MIGWMNFFGSAQRTSSPGSGGTQNRIGLLVAIGKTRFQETLSREVQNLT
jgi:hypothetical protein